MGDRAYHLPAVKPTKSTAWLAVGAIATIASGLYWQNRLGAGNVAPSFDPGAAAETRVAGRRDTLCTSASLVGIGLRGEYFAGPGLTGRRLVTRIDATVDVEMGKWPAELAQQPSSARWSGWIKAPVTGRYWFDVAPDTASVTVSRQVVAGLRAGNVIKPEPVDLVAGRHYPVTIEFSGTSGRVQLHWTLPHGARSVVPRVFLNLPTDTI
jgi:hypothetical protein